MAGACPGHVRFPACDIARLARAARAADTAVAAPSWSARSFMAWPAWPLHPVPVHDVVRAAPRRAAATGRRSSPASCRRCSSRCASSRGSSSVMPLRRYCAVGVEVDARTAASAPPAPRSPPSAPCGCWWCAARRPSDLLLVLAVGQDRAPAARAGIARAGAVGVDRDLLACASCRVTRRSRSAP